MLWLVALPYVKLERDSLTGSDVRLNASFIVFFLIFKQTKTYLHFSLGCSFSQMHLLCYMYAIITNIQTVQSKWSWADWLGVEKRVHFHFIKIYWSIFIHFMNSYINQKLLLGFLRGLAAMTTQSRRNSDGSDWETRGSFWQFETRRPAACWHKNDILTANYRLLRQQRRL